VINLGDDVPGAIDIDERVEVLIKDIVFLQIENLYP
jgi:hypothetical protein